MMTMATPAATLATNLQGSDPEPVAW